MRQLVIKICAKYLSQEVHAKDIFAILQNASKPAKDPFNTLKSSGIPPEVSSQQLLAVKMKRGQFHTIKESRMKRRCSINGHYYRNEVGGWHNVNMIT